MPSHRNIATTNVCEAAAGIDGAAGASVGTVVAAVSVGVSVALVVFCVATLIHSGASNTLDGTAEGWITLNAGSFNSSTSAENFLLALVWIRGTRFAIAYGLYA